jgi:hypothetical protein
VIRYLVCVILILGMVGDTMAASTSVQSKIGREDIYWCQDGASRTFSRRTSTGGAISLNCVGTADYGATNPSRTVYYVSNSASITNHAAAGTSESLAWCVAQLVSAGVRGTVVFPSKPTNYVLSDNYTIPETITVLRDAGTGVISPTSGIILTINGNFEAPPETAFGGDGSVTFATPGMTIHAKWFGGTNDGTADDTAAVQAAYDSITSGTILFSDDNWTFNLLINKDNIWLKGAGMMNTDATPSRYWRAYDVDSPVVRIGNDSAQITGVHVSDFVMNGNVNGSKYGLWVSTLSSGIFENFAILYMRDYSIKVGDSTATTYYCSANTFRNFYILTYGTADGIVKEYGTGSSFVTGQYFSDFWIFGPNDGTHRIVKNAAGLNFSDGWFQLQHNDSGILINTSEGKLTMHGVFIEGADENGTHIENTYSALPAEFVVQGDFYMQNGYYKRSDGTLENMKANTTYQASSFYTSPHGLEPVTRGSHHFVTYWDNDTKVDDVRLYRSGDDLYTYIKGQWVMNNPTLFLDTADFNYQAKFLGPMVADGNTTLTGDVYVTGDGVFSGNETFSYKLNINPSVTLPAGTTASNKPVVLFPLIQGAGSQASVLTEHVYWSVGSPYPYDNATVTSASLFHFVELPGVHKVLGAASGTINAGSIKLNINDEDWRIPIYKVMGDNVTMPGPLVVFGDTTLHGELDVDGNATVGGDLSITGYLTNHRRVIDVSDNNTLTSDLIVNTDVYQSGAKTTETPAVSELTVGDCWRIRNTGVGEIKVRPNAVDRLKIPDGTALADHIAMKCTGVACFAELCVDSSAGWTTWSYGGTWATE